MARKYEEKLEKLWLLNSGHTAFDLVGREADAEIADLREKCDKLAGAGWVSVEDRLPEEPGEVVVFCSKQYSTIPFVAGYVGDGKFIAPELVISEYEAVDGSMITEEVCPTHWAPFPDCPVQIAREVKDA